MLFFFEIYKEIFDMQGVLPKTQQITKKTKNILVNLTKNTTDNSEV
jgi:hypothetical protein